MEDLRNAKILVIDDSKLSRAHVRDTLLRTNMDMQITECENGQLGLDEFKKHKYDLILVDIVMPVMDGLTFLSHIKNDKSNFVPIILMTGNEDLDSKIKIVGLNVGADDFLQKPINEKELIARVHSLLRLKKTHDQLYEKNELIKKEMESARKVQQFIIPEDFSFISYPQVSATYLPMEDIGGDFYDCYQLENGNIGFLIADVTGHGIPAALVVTMSKMIFSIYAPRYSSAKQLLTRVNSEVFKLLLDYQYISAFYAIYDPKKKILRYSNAGHCLPLLYKKTTNKIKSLDTEQGFFVGMMEESFYMEKAVKIEKGDRLIMYTDGITEIQGKDKSEFGIEKLASYTVKNNNLTKDDFCLNLLNTINVFSNNAKKNDDIALLNIEF
jgi:serine phosphatase RsbU (regulator of sigma subunit)